MAPRSKRPCSYPGCNQLTTERFCEAHKKQERQRLDERRGSSSERGYGSRWRKARLYFLKEFPLCVECEKQGRLTAATVVDHIIPHKGNKELFWDTRNWRPLCKRCHDRTTVLYDGGFGREVRSKE